MSMGDARRLGALVIGCALLVTALAGPWLLDRALHSSRRGVPGYDYATAAPLSSFDDPRVQRRAGEDDLEYVRRATQVVDAAVYHCEPDEAQTWQTAATSGLGSVQTVTAYDIGDPGILTPKGLRCGFCSQVAFTLAEILRHNGIPDAKAYGLIGHVVTTFTLDGREYVADPDYGVGPFVADWGNPAQISATVREAYGALPDEVFMGTVSSPSLDTLVEVYADTEGDVAYSAHEVLRAVASEQAQRIELASLLRWIVAATGTALVALCLLIPRRRRAATRRPADQCRPR